MAGLLFTYGLAFGGTVASLFQPYIGLLVYISFAILKPDALWPWAVPSGNYSRIVAIGLLVGWALHGFGSWQWGRARGVVLAFAAFMAWSLVSAACAPDQERAWFFVDAIVKIFLPFVVGITLIDSVSKLKQLAWVIVLSQGFLAYEANLSYLSGYNIIRIAGLAGQPDNNGVALTMHTCSIIAFFLGLQSQGWWRKGLAFGAAALMVHAVLLSDSREGMLGLLVTAAVAFWLLPKRASHILVFSLAIVVALRLAGPEVRDRFASILADEAQRDPSAQSRFVLWHNCYDAMMQKPIVGQGPEHFALISYKYGWPEGKEAHNLWLKMGAELGVPGLFFLLTFYGLCVWRLWPIARSRNAAANPWLLDGARMVVASLSGYFVCTQFNNLYGMEAPYYVALLGAGVLKLYHKPVAELSETSPGTSAGDAVAVIPRSD